MADSFPGPYRNSISQDVDNPDPMIRRVPFSKTDIGARKSIMPSIKNSQTIQHTPNANSK
jgi:hypothetical protein